MFGGCGGMGKWMGGGGVITYLGRQRYFAPSRTHHKTLKTGKKQNHSMQKKHKIKNF
jgi:hypothetical protein